MHGAPTAWVKGDTGAGQTIAIIDTGIFSADPEFADRISADSTGIAGNPDSEADHDAQSGSLHGTEVAKVAAAAHDGQGTVGIAYGATIMMIRSDTPGSCAEKPNDDSCSFGDLTDGIRWAVDHGAAVINMSLGGSPAAPDEIAAVQYAADHGVVVVIAAGNDGKKSKGKNPDDFADSFANDDNVLIVGAVDIHGVIADFSNKAGTDRDVYLAALGVDVTVDETNAIYDDQNVFGISGTSFSAPQVAGAVALLKQAFPTLTAQQIVHLLLTTAQDVGAPGIDKIYGHGILDIYEAFQPQGTTSLAGSRTAVLPLGDTTAVASGPMGDALATASLDTIVLDGYARAYHYDLGREMRSAPIRPRMRDAVGNASRSVAIATDKAAMSFSIDNSPQIPGINFVGQMRLRPADAEASRVLAARVAMKLSPGSQLGFAYSEGSQGLVAQLQGQDRPAFLIATRAGDDDAMDQRSDISLAFRRQLGPWGLTFSGESGAAYSDAPLQLAQELDPRWTTDPVRSFALTLDRDWGALDGVVGVTLMDEDRTVLGARFHDAFGGGGARSVFVDLGGGWNIGDRWRLGAAWRSGWTFADTGGVIASGSVLRTSAWSVDLERRGVFGADDRLGVRVAQPLRVESGGLNLDLPVAYSYDTRSPTMGIERLNLAPTGREVLGEFAWSGPLMGGYASASLFYRQDPGNYAAAPDDKGAVVRWSKGF
jgi:hypothetical protein